jgi:hypothetical protein
VNRAGTHLGQMINGAFCGCFSAMSGIEGRAAR